VRTAIGAPYQWNGFVEVLGNPDALTGPRLADGVLRDRSRDVIHVVAAYLVGDVYVGAAAAGADPQANGNRSETLASHGVYRAGGDDDWVALACHDDEAWQRCCDVIGTIGGAKMVR